jgi:hypothetical protein
VAVADHKRVLSGWSKADIRKLEKRKEKAEMRQVLLMFVGLRIVRLQTASLQFDESQREDKEKRKSAKEDKYRQREQEREEAEAARVRSELCCAVSSSYSHPKTIASLQLEEEKKIMAEQAQKEQEEFDKWKVVTALFRTAFQSCRSLCENVAARTCFPSRTRVLTVMKMGRNPRGCCKSSWITLWYLNVIKRHRQF